MDLQMGQKEPRRMDGQSGLTLLRSKKGQAGHVTREAK